MSASKDQPAAPAILSGFDDSVVHLKVPKDPFQIGEVVKDGSLQPVWVDPKDFIPTPDQKLEQAANMRGMAFEANLEKAKWEVLGQVEAWLGRSIQALCPCLAQGEAAIQAWINASDINLAPGDACSGQVIHYLLRRGTKVLSEFKATMRFKE
jgi:hypothetical protein